jgi:hypothetical protein
VPLDVTNRAAVDVFVGRELARHHETRAASIVDGLVRTNPQLEAGTLFFWDPLAAVLAMHPDLGTTEAVMLRVATSGAELGRTIVGDGGAEVEWFARADVDAFERELLATLRGLDRVAPVDRTADLVVTIGGAGGCALSTEELRPGANVVEAALTGDDPQVALVGSLAPGYRADDLAAWLAAGNVDVPPWVNVTTVVGSLEPSPMRSLAVLEAVDATVACVDASNLARLELLGTAELQVSAE